MTHKQPSISHVCVFLLYTHLSTASCFEVFFWLQLSEKFSLGRRKYIGDTLAMVDLKKNVTLDFLQTAYLRNTEIRIDKVKHVTKKISTIVSPIYPYWQRVCIVLYATIQRHMYYKATTTKQQDLDNVKKRKDKELSM